MNRLFSAMFSNIHGARLYIVHHSTAHGEINIQAIKVPFHAVGNEMNIECIVQKHKVQISCISDLYRSLDLKLNLVFRTFRFGKEEVKPI